MSTPETDVESKPAKLPAKMEPAPQITFEIDPKRHPLQKTLRKLDKNLDLAMETVLAALLSEDLDMKTKLDAAKWWTETKIKVSQEVSKEVLTRQIAQVKMLQAMQPQRKIKDVEDEEDEQPTAIFSPQHILSVPTTTHM